MTPRTPTDCGLTFSRIGWSLGTISRNWSNGDVADRDVTVRSGRFGFLRLCHLDARSALGSVFVAIGVGDAVAGPASALVLEPQSGTSIWVDRVTAVGLLVWGGLAPSPAGAVSIELARRPGH